MLLWQRIEWPNRYSFLSKLFFFSMVMHCSMLFLLFFVYRGDNFTQHVNLDKQDITVMFLPFQKTVGGVSAAPSAAGAPSANKGSSGMKVVKASTEKIKKAAKTTTAQQKQQKKMPEIDAAPKTSLMAEIKKPKKKEVRPKKQVKQVKALPEKKIEQKVADPEKVIEPVVQPELVAEQTKSIELSLDESAENVVYAGQYDMDALELRQALKDEIERAWHPPVGLAANVCKVRVLIDWQGKIEDIVFEESSKVLAFDTSVRHALLTMNFPKSSYGKELILPFH